MNILFIDNNFQGTKSRVKKLIYDKFGFYIENDKKNGLISLTISKNNKVNIKILKYILRSILKCEKLYVVKSKYIRKSTILDNMIKNIVDDVVFVTEQNNLYQNDSRYIDNYIREKNLKREDIKVLIVIDKLEDKIKVKINEFIEKYKIINILVTKYENLKDVKKYVQNLNKCEGTAIEVIDKLHKIEYNILLVFSQEYEDIYYNNASFILNYNDSDLDIYSNTYLIYKNNEDYFYNMFFRVNMDISRFKKTKLGKLYIHTGRLILDK